MCAALALALPALAAAQASAQTITVVQPCVVATSTTNDTMTVNGAGFTAGDNVELQSTQGGAFGSAVVAAGGTFSATVTDPVLSTQAPGEQSFTLNATDETNAATATTTFESANLAFATKPATAKPTKKVTWMFSGFTSGDSIYGHYLHGGKVRATKNFGTATGPCGVLTTKAKFYPGIAKYLSYKLQVDDSAQYSASSTPSLVATLFTF
ncbi:MAG: hypothetical protein ABSG64_00245 [Solirubrobacteraceae bacterium]